MRSQYSDAFVEQALLKAHSRSGRSIRSVAEELNVEYETLKKWLQRKSVEKIRANAVKEKRPQDWRREEQLAALMETHGLSGEALNAWCRERGIFHHHLESWKADFAKGASEPVQDQRSARALKSENEKLKAELKRKEKALAEAAALLVLQKKFRALWDNEDN